VAAKAILIPLILFCILSSANAEYKVLSLQSVSVAPYEQAVAGFEEAFGFGTKKLIISSLKRKTVLQAIRDYSPDLVFSVGRDALLYAEDIDTVPVVFCMVLNPQAILDQKGNVRGVSMYLSPETQLSILSKLFPSLKNVGLLYDPTKTGAYVMGAEQAAPDMNIRLIARPVNRTQDVFPLIHDLKSEIDFFWMLPDTTVVTPDTVETILAFSFENNIGILAFAEKYVRLGATVSISIDAYDIGIQAGEMAAKIASGTPATVIPNEEAHKASTVLNGRVASKLGLTVNHNAVKDVEVVE